MSISERGSPLSASQGQMQRAFANPGFRVPHPEDEHQGERTMISRWSWGESNPRPSVGARTRYDHSRFEPTQVRWRVSCPSR